MVGTRTNLHCFVYRFILLRDSQQSTCGWVLHGSPCNQLWKTNHPVVVTLDCHLVRMKTHLGTKLLGTSGEVQGGGEGGTIHLAWGKCNPWGPELNEKQKATEHQNHPSLSPDHRCSKLSCLTLLPCLPRCAVLDYTFKLWAEASLCFLKFRESWRGVLSPQWESNWNR